MHDFRKSVVNSALRKVLKRLHYPLEVMLSCVTCYVAYPLSLRHIEEMIAKNAVFSLTTPLCNVGQSRWLVNGTGH
jgi:putative transposase